VSLVEVNINKISPCYKTCHSVKILSEQMQLDYIFQHHSEILVIKTYNHIMSCSEL